MSDKLETLLAEIEARANAAQLDTFLARSACRTDVPFLLSSLRECLASLGNIGHRSEPEHLTEERTIGYLMACEHIIEEANTIRARVEQLAEERKK